MPWPCRPPLAPLSLASLSQHHLVLEHLCNTRNITVHSPCSPRLGIGQNARVQTVPERASRRGERALDTPVRRALEQPTPPLQSLPLRRAPPLRPLATRHDRSTAAASSPSSSSESYRKDRRTRIDLLSNPFVLSLRQLVLEHRQDDAYKMLSSPCPFDRRRGHAVDAPLQHLTATLARYK
jgi:hypothetical protein